MFIQITKCHAHPLSSQLRMSTLRALQRPLRSVVFTTCALRRLPRTSPRRPTIFLNNEPLLGQSARHFQTSAASRAQEPATSTPNATSPESEPAASDEYVGPLGQTFRRVKIFSISSLAMSLTMTPLIFMLETSSAVPFVGRIALAGTVIVTSGVSTAMVAWCGRPYVNKLRYFSLENPTAPPSQVVAGQATGIELTTATLMLRERVTRVYDTAFLLPTNRPFAKWELATAFKLPNAEAAAEKAKGNLPREETVAETMDNTGKIIGRWIVKWDEDGAGTCREAGAVPRCDSPAMRVIDSHSFV